MALARTLDRAEPDSKRRLRLLLRLYAATSVVERAMRRFLRTRFATTLPRFDLMAALERTPDGLTMGELSRRLMVSGGNVTSIVAGLERDALVRRRSPASDRRTSYVALTERGRVAFAEMAEAHERWIYELLGDVADADVDALADLLAGLKHKVERRTRDEGSRVPSAAVPLGNARRRGRDHARSAPEEEPVDIRHLCRTARHLPRAG
jgi:DNA-binding MarR family transcriptional regulator